MPTLPSSTYQKPWYLFNPHLETIYPALTRRIRDVRYRRERLWLQDGDFVDLDWVDNDSQKLIVLTHGLEGNTDRHYIKGMARRFSRQGWDVLGWNCRSCSGEINLKSRLYNHGEIGDIGEVVGHALQQKDYQHIVLIGFSMGGNISLKYTGANAENLPSPVKGVIAFSAPVDLGESAQLLDLPDNRFYKNRFLRMLREKITQKEAQFPGLVDLSKLDQIEKWKDFDNFFSAPISGYKDADDFYQQGSAINYMGPIRIPCLLVNALNDPILSPKCFPKAFCDDHPRIFLETPKYGGHVGFSGGGEGVFNWAEQRAWQFVQSIL
ncbi:MAG: alpha/beta fold hydrolase [Bacteroidota bacterium]